MKLNAMTESLIALHVADSLERRFKNFESRELIKQTIQDAVIMAIEIIREKYKGDI